MKPARLIATETMRRAALALAGAFLFLIFSEGSALAVVRTAADDALQARIAGWVEDYIGEKNLDAALAVMTLVVAAYPDNPDAYALRGEVNIRANDLDAALNDFDRAAFLSPNDAFYHAERARIYALRGELGVAKDDLDRAVELGTRDADVYYYLGLYYLAMTQYARAEKEFTTAVELAPKSVDALLRRALCRYIQGNLEGALGDLNQVTQLTTSNSEALNLLGIVTATMGSTDEGLRILKKAQAIDPEFSGVYTNLGYTLFQSGDKDGAADQFLKAIELEPDSPYARCNIAEFFIHERDWKRALPAVRTCIARGREDLGFWRELRRYMRGMRMADDFLAAGDTGKFNFDALLAQGDAAFGDGDYERAYAPYALAMMLDLSDPRLLYHMGLTCLYLEEPFHAAGYFYQLIHIAPDSPQAAKAKFQLSRLNTDAR